MNDNVRMPGPVIAGRPMPAARDRIRRYCGLVWSGGPAETWAFRYYDAIPHAGPGIGPVDVLAAAAVHPGLSRADLAYFVDRAPEIADWLAQIPANATLVDVDSSVFESVLAMATWIEGPSLTLLSKVLHRVRPGLIPPVDRHMLDWYRHVTGERNARAAWPHLLHALRADVRAGDAELMAIADEVEAGTGVRLSGVRLIDIAVWMGTAR
ncbi:DUF6308 family protein [Georgenia yuyongxinii]